MKLRDLSIQFSHHSVLENCDFSASFGQITGVIGESGSGKSSLLNVLALLRYEGQCDFELGGIDLRGQSKDDLEVLQRTRIAYLRQDCLFIDTLSVIDQLVLEASIANRELSKKEAKVYLEKVHLEDKAKAYPKSLSGGEKQRLAIAMALAKEADILICDEITSALDEDNTKEIITILEELAHRQNKMVILSTHEADVIHNCDTIYEITDRKLNCIKRTNTNSNSELREVTKKKLPSSFYSHMVFARLKKKWLATLMTTFLCAIIVGFLSVALTYNYYSHEKFRTATNDSSSRELLIKRHVIGPWYPQWGYDTGEHSFEVDMYDKLKNLDGITNVYPFFGMEVMADEVFYDNVSGKGLFQIIDHGEVIVDYSDDYSVHGREDRITFGEKCGDKIFPYFDERLLQNKCKLVTNNQNGIYMPSYQAKELGITKINDTMSIKLRIHVPVGNYDCPSQISYDDKNGGGHTSYSVIALFDYYVPMDIELPISGILEDGYQDTFVFANWLYIPYEVASRLQAEAIQQHESYLYDTPVPYYDEELTIKRYQPRAYSVFYDEDTDPKELLNRIMALEEPDGIHYVDRFTQLEESRALQNEYDLALLMETGIITVVVLVMQLTYSYFHNVDVSSYDLFFLLRGINLKEQRRMTYIELSANIGMIFMLSNLMVPVMIHTYLDGFLFNNIKYFYMIIGLNVLLAIIISFLMETFLLLKK